MTFRTVEGFQTEKPLEIDEISSSTTVYIRKDITEVPNIDMDGKETGGTHWRYEEAQLTKDEYKTYQEIVDITSKKERSLKSLIDYVAIMADVDMEV